MSNNGGINSYSTLQSTIDSYDSDNDIINSNNTQYNDLSDTESGTVSNDIPLSHLPLKPVVPPLPYNINTTPRHTNKHISTANYSPVVINNNNEKLINVFVKPTQSPRLGASNTYNLSAAPSYPTNTSTIYIPQSPAYVYSPNPYTSQSSAYSPMHPSSQTPYSPSPHVSPRHHTIVQSPRIDTIQIINQRIDILNKNGRLQQLLRKATQCGVEFNTSLLQRNHTSYTPSHRSSLNNEPHSSTHALVTIDRYLKRRYVFKLIDIGTICKAVVSDKTDTSVTLTMIEVYQNSSMITSDLNDKPRLSTLSSYESIHELLIDLDDLNIHCTVDYNKLCDTTDDQTVHINRYHIGDMVKCVLCSVDTYQQLITASFKQSDCCTDMEHTLGKVNMQTPILNTNKHTLLHNHSTNSDSFNSSESPITQSSPTTIHSPPHNNNNNDNKQPLLQHASSLAPYGFPLANVPRRTKSNTNKSNIIKSIQKSFLFNSLNGYDIMCAAYNIPHTTSLLCNHTIDDRYLSSTLRVAQNNSWSRDSTLRGISYAKRGLFDQSMKCYQHALDINPAFVQAFIARGAAYVLMQQSYNAIQQFQDALEIDPTNVYAKQYLDDAKKKLANENQNTIHDVNHDNVDDTTEADEIRVSGKRSLDECISDQSHAPRTAAQRLKAARLHKSGNHQ